MLLKVNRIDKIDMQRNNSKTNLHDVGILAGINWKNLFSKLKDEVKKNDMWRLILFIIAKPFHTTIALHIWHILVEKELIKVSCTIIVIMHFYKLFTHF